MVGDTLHKLEVLTPCIHLVTTETINRIHAYCCIVCYPNLVRSYCVYDSNRQPWLTYML